MLAGEAEVRDDLLEHLVGEVRRSTSGHAAGAEQRRAKAGEDELAGVVAAERLLGGVAVVDEPEQDVERVLEVPGVAGVVAVELDERGVAEPGHAVAGLVVGVVAGEDPELGPRLGEEQHDDPVEVAKALAREVARVDRRPGALLPVRGRRATTALARISTLRRMPWRSSFDTPADSVAARLEQAREDALRFVAGVDRVGAEQRGDGGELALGLGVVAGQGVVEVGAEPDALAPAIAVEQRDRAAGHEQEVARRRRRR